MEILNKRKGQTKVANRNLKNAKTSISTKYTITNEKQI